MQKFVQFVLDVKTELFKVVWPSRKDTLKYTLVVVVFSLVFAAILGAADYGLVQFLEKIVNR